jgi:transposase-like protein
MFREADLVQAPPLPGRRIRHAVWLYFRFSLSSRDFEELLAQRGLDVSYETISAGRSSSVP